MKIKTNFNRDRQTSYNKWGCLLQMEDGGVLRLSYRADNEEQATEIAEKTAKIFGGNILDVFFDERQESKI